MIYYYPNRPILIPPDPENPLDPRPDYINGLESSGQYIAEQKWNGDNCLVYILPDGSLQFWSRHRTQLKYTPSPAVAAELLLWPLDSILNVELVHNRTKTVKDTLIVHCIMRWKGKWLMGKTWGYSRKLLERGSHGEHVIVSPVWTTGFWDLFQEADGTIIEGIILKDPKGALVFSANKSPDVGWMRKIRKPCKKYNF